MVDGIRASRRAEMQRFHKARQVRRAHFNHARVEHIVFRARSTLLRRLLKRQTEFTTKFSVGRSEASAHFLRTSPKSGAPVTPTTIYVPLSSFKHAMTNGSVRTVWPFFASRSAHRSRVASTSHKASLLKVEGWQKRRRSGPSRMVAKRKVRSGRMAALSSSAEP